jgi:aarF domain-containing kinase
MQRHYSDRLAPYPKDYYTPKVFTDMTTKHIICTEFVDGVEIDTLTSEPQKTKDRAGELLLKLCFKELFEWHIM